MSREMYINFGMLSGSVREQLEEQGVEIDESFNIKKFEGILKSIKMLYVHGLVSDSEKDKLCKKFMKKLTKELEEVE